MRVETKAQLARIAGVSRPGVSRHCRPGGKLHDATTPDGIDVEHPLVTEFLAGHGVYDLPPKDGADKAKPSPKPKAKATSDSDKELEDMTIREVVMRHGSVDGFKRFVDALKSISEYKYRDLRVQQQRGDLVEREKVAGLVFPLLEVAFSRLVSDVPGTVAKKATARAESGGPDTSRDIAEMIRDANSRVLQDAKKSIENLEVLK